MRLRGVSLLRRPSSASSVLYSATLASRSIRSYTSMAVQQPPWSLPKRKEDEPVLKIYNSLTKSKTEFVAINGRHVKWYNCGPTVYDASHMGHARNYVTQDVLRRIMTDYFGYDVHFVMNITDIDDKIILRARQSYLVNKFRSETDALSRDLVDQLETAWADFVQSKVSKGLPDTDRPSKGKEKEAWPLLVTQFQDKAWKQEGLKRDEKFEMHFSAAHRTYAALLAAGESLKASDSSQQLAHRLIDEAHDILAISLDKQVR